MPLESRVTHLAIFKSLGTRSLVHISTGDKDYYAPKRVLTLSDGSGTIHLTLWGTFAQAVKDEWLGKAILLRDCKIEQYLGHSIKSCGKTFVSVGPPLVEAERLLLWHDQSTAA